jgi:hypothetical protein
VLALPGCDGDFEEGLIFNLSHYSIFSSIKTVNFVEFSWPFIGFAEFGFLPYSEILSLIPNSPLFLLVPKI